MKITLLGTGTSQGVPVISCTCIVCRSDDPKDSRLRTSLLIEDGEDVFLIDCGPDFRQQLLRENVTRLDALIFTHEHKDHTAGLDDIRAFNYTQRKPMDVYATKQVQKALRQQYGYIFEEHKYPGIPDLNLITIHNEPFTINQTTFLPIQVLHYHLPVLGFRIEGFTYITDANNIPEKEKEKIRGTDILVINALRKEPHISHFTLDEALQLIEELKPGKAYLTHISHQMGLHEEVEKSLPENIHLAYDGISFTF